MKLNLLFLSLMLVAFNQPGRLFAQNLEQSKERQLAQIRLEYFGSTSINYREVTLRADLPAQLFDLENRRIELKSLPVSGSGRYVYYPLRIGALLLDGSALMEVRDNGQMSALTEQLNTVESEKTYNFQNGVMGPLQTIAYLDGTINGGDPLGFRTGDYLRSDLLVHAKFLGNQVAPNSVPVVEVYFGYDTKNKKYKPNLIRGFNLGITNRVTVSNAVDKCEVKPGANELERILKCTAGTTLYTDVTNEVLLFKKKILLHRITFGNHCGSEFRNRKNMIGFSMGVPLEMLYTETSTWAVHR